MNKLYRYPLIDTLLPRVRPMALEQRFMFDAAVASTATHTVRRMEAGHPGTALVHFARVMQAFGELDKLDQLLETSQDTVGLTLMDEKLPQRVRKPRKPRKPRKTPETGAF
jgi:hypothetical protein